MMTSVKAVFLACVVLLGVTASAAAQADDPHYVAGVKAFQEGDYDQATSELRASIKAHPTPKAALYLGNAYLKNNKLAQARDALNMVLRLDPKSPKRQAILTLIHSIEARGTGKVVIASTPPGVSIVIDAETTERFKTPGEAALPLGPHSVTAQLEGYESETREFQAAAGETLKLDFNLRAKGCDLALSAAQTGSQASLDGAERVVLPATLRVGVGDHKVLVMANTFEDKNLTVSCDGTHPLVLNTTLMAKGRLKVPTAAGTVVMVDGKVVEVSADDATAGIGLPVGRHEVTVKMDGRAPFTKIVDIAADAEAPVVDVPKAMAADDAAAQAPAPPIHGYPGLALYLGPQLGGNIALQNWKLGSNSFIAQDNTHGLHAGSSATAGAFVGLQIVRRFAVEAELRWVGLPSDASFSHGLTYDLNLLFNLLAGDWTPTLQAGFGNYHSLSGGLGTGQALRGHAGIGLRGKLTPWLTLRVDARDVLTTGFGKPANNLEALVGFEFYAWRSSTTAAATQ